MVDVVKNKPIHHSINRSVCCARETIIPFLVFNFTLFVFSCQTAVAETLRDPTRPPTASSAPRSTTQDKEIEIYTSGPRLQAIMISDKHRSAIISGKSVGIGDKIGNAQVIRINESEVVLKDGDSFKTLKIFTHGSKQIKINNQQVTR